VGEGLHDAGAPRQLRAEVLTAPLLEVEIPGRSRRSPDRHVQAGQWVSLDPGNGPVPVRGRLPAGGAAAVAPRAAAG
jgi:hypothetical protein